MKLTTAQPLEEKLSQANMLQEKITELETSPNFLSPTDINSIQEKTWQKVQVSISPIIYEELFSAQIPKVQKDMDDLTVFFAVVGSLSVKAACEMLLKTTPGCKFVEHNHSRT